MKGRKKRRIRAWKREGYGPKRRGSAHLLGLLCWHRMKEIYFGVEDVFYVVAGSKHINRPQAKTDSLSSGMWSASSKSKYRYSANRLDTFPFALYARLTQSFSEPERLHPVQLLGRHRLHILNTCITTFFDPTPLLESLEYLPSPSAVLLITGGSVGEKERLDSLGSKDIAPIDEDAVATTLSAC